ncbi:Uncharacterised protein [Mycobacteroides abscessus subsp. abscessus]|nr:Uncharacterised protein [Mycobacteroides abscessus subsp. abscessus]
MPVPAAPPFARSRSDSDSVIGTPSATPVAPPKLRVMSDRSTPDWTRTFGPLVPSPG